MSRLGLGLAAAACGVVAWSLAPARPAVTAEARGLGPLRPLAAELTLLRAEMRHLDGDSFGFVEDVRRVLALRADRESLWLAFAFRFLLDLPRREPELAGRQRWFDAGLSLLADGLRHHPTSAELRLARATGVFVTLEQEPERAIRLSGGTPNGTAAVLLGVCTDASAGVERLATGSVAHGQACDVLALALRRLAREHPALLRRSSGREWLDLLERQPQAARMEEVETLVEIRAALEGG